MSRTKINSEGVNTTPAFSVIGLFRERRTLVKLEATY